MKTRFILPILAASLFASIAWVPARQADEDKTISAADISEVIKDLKLEAEEEKDSEDKTFWTITTKDDEKIVLYQYGGKGDVATSLGVSAFFKEEADLDVLDSWNRDARFTKAYSADDELIVLESDVDLSVSPSKAAVKRFLETFTTAIPKFIETLK